MKKEISPENQHEYTSFVDLDNPVARCKTIIGEYFEFMEVAIFAPQFEGIAAQSIYINGIDNIVRMRDFLNAAIDDYNNATNSIKLVGEDS